MEQGLLQNGSFVEIVNDRAVPLIAHKGSTRGADAEHDPETRRDPRTGEEIEVCPVYEGISCDVHHRVYDAARRQFDFRGTPATFIASPDGEVIFGNDELRSMSPGFFEEKFDEAQRELGPGIPGSIWNAVHARMAEVDRLIEEEEYGDAIEGAQEIAEEDRLPESLRGLAEERLDRLTEIGLEKVEAAAAEDDRRELRRIRRDWRDLDEVADAAREAMD